MKYEIRAIQNIGPVHRYEIERTRGVHGNIISLLQELGFSEKATSEFDIPLESSEGEYLYAEENDIDVRVFVADAINLIIKTGMEQEKLVKSMMKYFLMPGQ